MLADTVTTAQLLTTFDVVNFVMGLVGTIVGIGSLILAILYKRESDRVNQRTTDLLIEVKTDAKAIAGVAAGELQKYGDTMRSLALGGPLSAAGADAPAAEAPPKKED